MNMAAERVKNVLAPLKTHLDLITSEHRNSMGGFWTLIAHKDVMGLRPTQTGLQACELFFFFLALSDSPFSKIILARWVVAYSRTNLD